MQSNTINTSSTLQGISIGGISLSIVLGGLLVYSTFMTNRANKKLMFQQSSKLTKEGFPPAQDLLDQAFTKIQALGSDTAAPIKTASADGCFSAAGGFDAMNVETWGNPPRKNLPIYGN